VGQKYPHVTRRVLEDDGAVTVKHICRRLEDLGVQDPAVRSIDPEVLTVGDLDVSCALGHDEPRSRRSG
jgi:hypothetical protein